jgi:deoxyhypusine synthase
LVESLEKVGDPRIRPDMTLEQLVRAYGDIYGFMAGHLYRAVSILREGLSGSELRILTFTGNLVSTGLRGVFADMIREGLFNVVITTTGALDHDIARSMGGEYLKGYFEADDVELHEKGYHRLGNIFIPVENYGPLVEKFVRNLIEEAVKGSGEWAISDLLHLAGSIIGDNRSILRSAYESGTEIFVPGWPDGAFGTALFTEAQRSGKKFVIDYFKDMKKLADLFFPSTRGKATALIVGGGISKHHAIWWSQFREGLDYAVYVTTAVEYDGSLSGAHPREAITWGKLKPRSKHVVVYGDATIVIPIIYAGISGVRGR